MEICTEISGMSEGMEGDRAGWKFVLKFQV